WSHRPVDQIENRSVNRIPTWRSSEVGGGAKRNRARRGVKVFRHDERAHNAERGFLGYRRLLARERNFFFDHANRSDRKRNRNREDALPLAAGPAQHVDEVVAALSLIFDVKRFVR